MDSLFFCSNDKPPVASDPTAKEGNEEELEKEPAQLDAF